MMDQRLECIRFMTPPCRGVADVGTDHGLLICQLVGEGRAQWGIATDIHEKPLDKARQEAARLGLGDKIRCMLADGLGDLPADGLDAVIIAGMGGETIQHIIESWPHSKRKEITWLLQPMTKAERLRRWLYENGYEIIREPCCQAVGRIYSVMEVKFSGNVCTPDYKMVFFGMTMQNQDTESREYCKKVLHRLQKKAQGLGSAGGEKAEYYRCVCRELSAYMQEKGVKT